VEITSSWEFEIKNLAEKRMSPKYEMASAIKVKLAPIPRRDIRIIEMRTKKWNYPSPCLLHNLLLRLISPKGKVNIVVNTLWHLMPSD
jgi:hypothetical protein